MGTIDRRRLHRATTVVEVVEECADLERRVLRIDPNVIVGDAPESPRGYAWHTLTTVYADPLESEAAITAVLQQLRVDASQGHLPLFRVVVGGYTVDPRIIKDLHELQASHD